MRPDRFLPLLAVLSVVPGAGGFQDAAQFRGASPLEWSVRLARAEIARRGSSLEFGNGAKETWSYPTGIFAYALGRLGDASGDRSYTAYADRTIDSFILPDGAIRGFAPGEFSLDQIAPGRAVFAQYERSNDPRLRETLSFLRGRLREQPRTGDGAFWHKRIYPDQMWLDGLYMAGPFYAHFGRVFDDSQATADAARQIELADRHLYDGRTGLYYHAWDASRSQGWSDPKTGRSPNFWARAIGWYAMAAVDVLDDLPPGSADARAVAAILRRVADGIVRWQDPATGVWWQVMDQPARPGNYLEASASSMFVYVLSKAVNRGRLPAEPYGAAARRGYAGLVTEFVRADSAGRTTLTHCCSVAGLGNRNAAGLPRDGSFTYYVSEPVVTDDLKGVAAFILAGLEAQRIPVPGPSSRAR